MILYKYLQPDRLDLLKRRMVRFTQPGDFNDPFEFRPRIRDIASDVEVQAYVEANFEDIVKTELSKYGGLTQFLPQAGLMDLIIEQKHLMPALFKALTLDVIQELSPAMDNFFNQNVGVFCLSEVRNSILMWSHYAASHQGFAVGFDSTHSFFSQRKTDQDEFGFLRCVNYSALRPEVTLSDTSSPSWFSTKDERWSYEKEWRIVRILSEADDCIDHDPYSICLFEFPPDAVREIIFGLKSTPSLINEVRALVQNLPKVKFFKVNEHAGYDLVVSEI